MGEIVSFRGLTKLDIDPDRMLEGNKGEFKHLVMFGYDHDDNFIFASNMAAV